MDNEKLQRKAAEIVGMNRRIAEEHNCHEAVVVMASNLANEKAKAIGAAITKEAWETIFWETFSHERDIYSRDPKAYLKYAEQATKPKPEDIEGKTKVQVTFGGQNAH